MGGGNDYVTTIVSVNGSICWRLLIGSFNRTVLNEDGPIAVDLVTLRQDI